MSENPYRELIDFLVAKLEPETLLAFELSDDAQERAAKLIELNANGELTPELRAELNLFLDFDAYTHLLVTEAMVALREREQTMAQV